MSAFDREEAAEDLGDLLATGRNLTGIAGSDSAGGLGLGAGALGSAGAADAALFAARRHRTESEPCLVPTGLVCRLPAGANGTLDVQFSPGGKFLAAACSDGDSYPIRYVRRTLCKHCANIVQTLCKSESEASITRTKLNPILKNKNLSAGCTTQRP